MLVCSYQTPTTKGPPMAAAWLTLRTSGGKTLYLSYRCG